MKFMILSIWNVLSLLMVLVGSVHVANAADSRRLVNEVEASWQLEKHDKDLGIKVFTREVPGSELKAFRGEMVLTSTLSAPIALLEDTSQAPEWMHNCGIVEIIEYKNAGEALSYMITEAPWPVSDRDTIVHSVASQDPDTLAVRVDVTARNDVFPANDEYVRVTQMRGFWLFSPMKNGELNVIYEVHAEPGGGLPSWLANSVVVDTPYHTLKNMQKIIRSERYQNAELSFIKNH